ncbi:MAG: hypothetical protein ACJ8ER_00785 [Allosphingosinicella sp.]
MRALERGMSLTDAATAVGFRFLAMLNARKRDPVFAEACEKALEQANKPRLILRTKGHKWRLRRPGNLRFTEARQKVFLDHFAGTCDEQAAIEAAGVCAKTVYRHRLLNPEFAARYRAVLELVYDRLEAEMLRQRLAMQKRIAEGLSKGIEPTGEIAQEFERVLKLLTRWDRRQGAPGPRSVGHGRQERWDFDDAIDEIERKLRNMGVPIRDTDSKEGGQ